MTIGSATRAKRALRVLLFLFVPMSVTYLLLVFGPPRTHADSPIVAPAGMSIVRCGLGWNFASCYANGEYGDGPLDAAWRGADGVLSTRWSSLETVNSWWRATFSQPALVTQVTIWGRGGGDTQQGQLQFSDGSTVDDGSLSGDGCAHTVSFAARVTTFVTYHVTGNWRSTTGFQDFEAYSVATNPDGNNCSVFTHDGYQPPTPTPTNTFTPTSTPTPTITPTPVPYGWVGGIAEPPEVAGPYSEASTSRTSPVPVPAEVAAILAASLVVLGSVAWYARRRWRA